MRSALSCGCEFDSQLLLVRCLKHRKSEQAGIDVIIGQLQEDLRARNLKYEEARNLNHDLADMVRCLEWTDPKGEVPSHCPWCEVQKPNHDNPCKLKILIDKGYIPNRRTQPIPSDPNRCFCAGTEHCRWCGKDPCACEKRNVEAKR